MDAHAGWHPSVQTNWAKVKLDWLKDPVAFFAIQYTGRCTTWPLVAIAFFTLPHILVLVPDPKSGRLRDGALFLEREVVGGRVLGHEIFFSLFSMAIARARDRHRTNSIFSKGSLARFFQLFLLCREIFENCPTPPPSKNNSPSLDGLVFICNECFGCSSL